MNVKVIIQQVCIFIPFMNFMIIVKFLGYIQFEESLIESIQIYKVDKELSFGVDDDVSELHFIF